MSDLPQLMNIEDIIEATTLSRPTIYRMIKEEKFPKGHMITARRRVWKREDIAEVINKMLDAAN